MIVKCEGCKSEFNIDETLIKESGSKVRCSVCRNLFTIYPPIADDEMADDFVQDEALEETVALDFPPVFDESETEQGDEEVAETFEKAFEDALEDDTIEDIAREDLSGPEFNLDTTPDLIDGADASDEDFDDDLGKAPIASKGRGTKPVVLVVLSLILIAIIIFLLLFFMAPNLLPDVFSSLKPVDKEEVLDSGVRRLTFKDVNGVFMQSSKAGQLFVLKGSIYNDDIVSRSHTLLKGVILDDKGEAVNRKLVYAGNIFTDNELSGVSLEEIEERPKNREGNGGINVNVAPGGSVPFMIVFAGLPENLGEFMIEAVSSTKGE